MAIPTQGPDELYVCPICVDGEWRASLGRTQILHNPGTGAPLTMAPNCTSEEVQAAIASAHAAFDSWRQVPVPQRAQVLFRFREQLQAHFEELAALITQENGKTFEESRGSLRRGMEAVELACAIPTLLMGDSLENVAPGIDCRTIRQHLGVCAGIPPFNFPAMIPLWMFPLAVACGNTFVLKPSDKTPRTSIRLVELLYAAGLPGGVVNVVHGAKEVADILLNDPRVKAISFVGSAAVAKYVYETAAAAGKRVQALGGAKNHLVAMPGADRKVAVEAILSSAFGCAGQRCMAATVVVAVGEAAASLVEELVEASDAIRVGAGDHPQTEMGPVISVTAKQRICEYIEIGMREGATLARDGRTVTPHDRSNGFYIGPTIFDHVRPGMRIAQEEIFGPVLCIVRARDLREALEIVNRSDYGNGASIFTASGAEAREFASQVQAGMVGINVGVPAPPAFFPFAGWKGSFYGDLHAVGKDAIHFYTETKVVTSRWPH